MSERHDARTDDPAGLAEVLEAAHEAFVAIDERGVITAWNREAERTFGWARQVAVGSLLRDLIIPRRYRTRHEEGLRRFLDTGTGPLIDKRIEIAALHRNGHEFPVELTITALRQRSGWSFNAFVHDITDRYRANEFQARLATIVEHSAEAIVARTRDGLVTAWNPAAEALFGYTADEMVGQTLDGLLPGDRRGEVEELLAIVLRGEPVRDFETVRVAKNGRLLDVSLTISPIRDDAGEVVEISMIVRDVGERKRAERAVEVARVDEQKMTVQAAPVGVAEVARAVLAERRVEMSFELAADEAAVARADPDHVHQILVNYVENALAYGSPPYRVEIERDDAAVTPPGRHPGPRVPGPVPPRP